MNTIEGSTYSIIIRPLGAQKPLKLHYNTKDEAMDAWDSFVDNALDGDTMSLKRNEWLLSEYTQVLRGI